MSGKAIRPIDARRDRTGWTPAASEPPLSEVPVPAVPVPGETVLPVPPETAQLGAMAILRIGGFLVLYLNAAAVFLGVMAQAIARGRLASSSPGRTLRWAGSCWRSTR